MNNEEWKQREISNITLPYTLFLQNFDHERVSNHKLHYKLFLQNNHWTYSALAYRSFILFQGYHKEYIMLHDRKLDILEQAQYYAIWQYLPTKSERMKYLLQYKYYFSPFAIII